MHAVISAFGRTAFIVRLPSCIAAICSIIVIYQIGKRYINPSVGLLSAFLLTLSPFHIWYAHEARVYSISILLVLLIFLLYARIVTHKRGRTGDILIFIILSAVAFLSHYLALFVILPLFVHIMIKRTIYAKKIFLYGTPLACILIAPFIFIAFNQIKAVKTTLWLTRPKPLYFIYTIGNLVFGYTLPPAILIICSLAILALFGYLVIRMKKNSLCIVLSFCSIIPLILLYIISQKIPVFLPRQLCVFSPFIILMLAWSILSLRTRILRIAIIILITLCSIVGIQRYHSMTLSDNIYSHRGVLPKTPVRPVVDYLKEHIDDKNNTVIVHTIDFSVPVLLYYMNGYNQAVVTTLKTNVKKPTSHLRVDYFVSYIRLDDPNDIATLVHGLSAYDSLWLIRTNWRRNGEIDSTSNQIKSLCELSYTEKEQDAFDYKGIYINHFVRKPSKQ
jgi:hypothetical protein